MESNHTSQRQLFYRQPHVHSGILRVEVRKRFALLLRCFADTSVDFFGNGPGPRCQRAKKKDVYNYVYYLSSGPDGVRTHDFLLDKEAICH